MAGAIWSCPLAQMLEFPARTFVRFFANHSLLSLTGQPQWRTLEGGSQTYVERLCAPFADRIRLGCGAAQVTRHAAGVEIRDASGASERFDQIVFACHADQALAALTDPDAEERKALGAIRYQKNLAILHTDTSIMPKNRPCWASWVYHADGEGDEPEISVTYWMNSLQGIDQNYPLFVTLNPNRPIAEDKIFDRHVFDHPVFDFGALAGQAALKQMQGRNNTWFCGAHLGHGFHEDGLVSAMRVAEALGAPEPWTDRGRAAEKVKAGWIGYRPFRPAPADAPAAISLRAMR